jgi:polyphosphate kinase
MVRVAGLKRRHEMGLTLASADGLSPTETLARIAEKSRELAVRQASCFGEDIAPALDAEGIHIRAGNTSMTTSGPGWPTTSSPRSSRCSTPLAVDPAHPFPYISGLSLNLGVLVRDPDPAPSGFARIKVPNNIPRFVVVVPSAVEAEFPAARGPHRRAPRRCCSRHDVVEHHLSGHPQRRP